MDSWLLRWDTRCDEGPSFLGLEAATGSAVDTVAAPDGSMCVTDGYVFDLPRGLSPAAWVLDRYRHSATDLMDRLRGGYSLALWDPGLRCLTLARDAMGIRPLFYSWQEGVLIASPSMRAMRDQPDVSSEINAQLAAEMLIDRFHPGQCKETYFQHITRLPSAHLLRIRDGQLERYRYWDPLPGEFEWASDEELSRFPSLLEAAVERCLAVGVDSIALSGGFDSVGIAIVASELRGDRPPLHALSLRMVGGPADEGGIQQAVAEALHMPQTMRTLDDCLAATPPLTSAMARSTSSPNPVMSMWQPAYTSLLASGSEVGLSKLMLGTGGDETLGVGPTYAADCLGAGRLGALWRYYRAAYRSSQSSATQVLGRVLLNSTRRLLLHSATKTTRRFTPGLHRRLQGLRLRRWQRRSPWMEHDRLRRTLARDYRHNSPADAAGGLYARSARRLLQHPLLMLERDQGSAWADALGYQHFYPFWDRDLVDLLLRVHPEKLIAGGRFKAPLRRLVAQRLGEVQLPTHKVDFTQSCIDLVRKTGPAAWQTLGDELELGRIGVVDPMRLGQFLNQFFAGRNDHWVTAWIVLSTEIWLRAQRS